MYILRYRNLPPKACFYAAISLLLRCDGFKQQTNLRHRCKNFAWGLRSRACDNGASAWACSATTSLMKSKRRGLGVPCMEIDDSHASTDALCRMQLFVECIAFVTESLITPLLSLVPLLSLLKTLQPRVMCIRTSPSCR